MTGPSYELLDHTADLGFRVRAPDEASVFRGAAWALFDVITPAAGIGEEGCARSLELAGDDRAALLHTFLEELLFHFEVDGELLPHVLALELLESGGTWTLRAELAGELQDGEKHPIDRVVKAITWHGLRVEAEDSGEGWLCEVILDL